MEIPYFKHEIKKLSEHKYGYIYFTVDQGEDPIKFFTEDEFTIIFNNRKIKGRKIDVDKRRLNLYPLRESLNISDILYFKRIDDNKINLEIISHESGF